MKTIKKYELMPSLRWRLKHISTLDSGLPITQWMLHWFYEVSFWWHSCSVHATKLFRFWVRLTRLFYLELLMCSQLYLKNASTHCSVCRGSLGGGGCNLFRLLIVTVQFLTSEVFMERDEEGETDIWPTVWGLCGCCVFKHLSSAFIHGIWLVGSWI